MFSNRLTKRDIGYARTAIWWTFVLEIVFAVLPYFGIPSTSFAPLFIVVALVLLELYYLLFYGFSRMAKHFHRINLFWFFFLQFIFSVVFVFINVTENLFYYTVFDPYQDMIANAALLFGTVFSFAYGYLVMELPHKKFGPLLFRIRLANIAKAFAMSLIVSLTLMPNFTELLGLYRFILTLYLALIVVCYYYDYALLRKSLRIIGAVAPRPAPAPSTAHHDK